MANKNYTNHRCSDCKKSYKKYPTGLATTERCATCAPKFAEAEAERLRKEAAAASGLTEKEAQKKARREALDARDLAIVSAVLSGAARKSVADQFKVSQSLIHEALIAHGYKRPSKKHAERDAAIIAAVDSGKSLEVVAAEFNMSANRVRLIYAAKDAKPLPKPASGESAAA
jgi:transposase